MTALGVHQQMSFRTLIKRSMPPALLDVALLANRHLRGYGAPARLSGDYGSWASAQAASTGYDAAAILEQTLQAALQVRDGLASYERDSVLFHEPSYSWPLVASALRAALEDGGELSVLDFGGSLGSAYFQHRVMFEGVCRYRWSVVEQPGHVAAGRASLADEHLSFHDTVAESVAHARPNVVVLGSVLHYLESPYKTLAELAGTTARYFVVDRTPYFDGGHDRLCVQRVDEMIYKATYPCWIFSRAGFLREVDALGLRVVSTFPAFDNIPGPVPVTYQGMVLERITAAAAAAVRGRRGDG